MLTEKLQMNILFVITTEMKKYGYFALEWEKKGKILSGGL